MDGRVRDIVTPAFLLAALDDLLVYLGFALLLLSLLALFPPGGLALAGVGVVGVAMSTEMAVTLGVSGVAPMGAGAAGADTGGADSGSRSEVPQWLRDKWNSGRKFNEEKWPRYPANEVYLENGKVRVCQFNG